MMTGQAETPAVDEELAGQLDPLLFGHDPTPGIVSVAADRQGRATVWRRTPAGLVTETDRFPNWFLLSDLASVGGMLTAKLSLLTLLSLVLVAATAWILWRTPFGLRLRSCGESPAAAESLGINVYRYKFIAVLISGGFAGLAGMIQVTGVFHRVFDGFSSGYGFDAIAVALLGKNSPIGIALAALLFGAFARGGSIMQANAGVSAQLVSVIEAVVLFVIAAELIVRVLTARRRERKPLEAIA